MDGNGARRLAVWIGTLFEASLAAAACLVGWLAGTPPWSLMRWNVRHAGLGVLAAVPLLALFLGTLRVRWGPLERIRRVLDEVAGPLLAGSSMIDLAMLAGSAGLGEEMLFRGVLQPLVGRWLGRWAAVVVTGLLFGLAHPITVTYAVVASLIGVYLGWLSVVTGNLLPAILTHALYDFVALVYLVRIRWRPSRDGALDRPE